MYLVDKLIALASILLPEEVIADLIYLHQNLISQNKSRLQIVIIILGNSLSFILSLYNIKRIIENFCFSVQRLQKPILLFLLHKLLPEEYVGNFVALYQQQKSYNQSLWLTLIIVIHNFLGLFWASYIEINIENPWLPSQKNKKK